MYCTVYLYVGVYFVCTNLYINSLLCTILYIHECSVHCVLLLYIYVQMVLFSIFMYGLYTSYLFTGGTVQKCPARVVLCTVLCICVQVLYVFVEVCTVLCINVQVCTVYCNI